MKVSAGIVAAVVMLALAGTAQAKSKAPEIDLVEVKGGTYQQGDTFDTGGEDEKPVHQVTVSDFYLGKFEVTQGQWKAVMKTNPSHFQGDSLPVENVSWDDAQFFIKRLNKLTGKKYRLPTESEWEYAARSGGGDKYAGTSKGLDKETKENELADYAWYDMNSGGQTHAVGVKKPNALGIHDLSGNVWEWVQDRYAADYYAKSATENPQGPETGQDRVRRGGGWTSSERGVRNTFRYGDFANARNDFVGFRLALSREDLVAGHKAVRK
ncbi:formylglycine-generating enzyme family protein [Geomonas subterranea]|uniref:Formylglycine-generating enzyme family protein n=1 Tax=Geomonas subterranea TaxID=2847989 RepID=A0ABX8LPC2_9BACT|nr:MULTISPECIES: SUMF1/EgtB/PvdO family nonheme iron enzyme [Geomonas]QXE91380.1 formylglycine-generating enzyme family protein [Geomonas subterranea]QXM10533.1 formylglycine-generating enzyme family protein [Geomonas subterranea]